MQTFISTCYIAELSIFAYLQCAENVELHEKVNQLERRLASVSGETSSEHCVSEEYVEELKKKIQSQVII